MFVTMNYVYKNIKSTQNPVNYVYKIMERENVQANVCYNELCV